MFESPVLGTPIVLDLMGLHPQAATAAHIDVAREIAEHQAATLRKADLYLADADMSTLVDTAAPSMPDQTLDESDPLSKFGYLYFETPLTDRTGTDPAVPIHAISWAVLPDGHPLLDERGIGSSVLLTAYVLTAEYAEAMYGSSAAVAPGAPRLLPNATVMWAIDSLIGEVYGEAPPTDVPVTPGFYQRVIAAFWTLAKQPLSETVRESPGPGAQKKRFARAGIERPEQAVQVVRLQHRAASGAASGAKGEPTGRHVSVQFAVRGFWRAQPYGEKRAMRRQQFIAPHLRGPADAPFKASEKVFLASPPKDQRPPKA
jgi:hypothetical protein